MKPIIILLLSLLPFGAFAGEPAPASAAGEPTVAELSAQLEALKARTSTWDKIAARLPRISGYVQTGYEWSETSSTFFIKRVRLNLAGDIAEKLDYRVQIEFCGPKIVDAYIRYRPFEQPNFQLGEYKLPFSIENTDYVPLKYEFIEYPLSLRRLMGFNDVCGLSATGRDMGAMLYGGFFNRKGYSVLGYNFGVFNGEGLNVKDKNKSKDLVARLTLRPVRGLQIAGSYYWGEYGPDYRRRVRYGAGVCYDRGAVVLRSEWIGGETDVTTGDSGLYGGSRVAAGTSWEAGTQPGHLPRSCVTIPSSSRSPSPPRVSPTVRPALSGNLCGTCAVSSITPMNRMPLSASPTGTCSPSSLPGCSDDLISF